MKYQGIKIIIIIHLFDIIDETQLDIKLEIRSVERGICPIATSTMNELFSYNYGA